MRVVAELAAAERDDGLLESAVSRPSLEPLVTSVRWEVEPSKRNSRSRSASVHVPAAQESSPVPIIAPVQRANCRRSSTQASAPGAERSSPRKWLMVSYWSY